MEVTLLCRLVAPNPNGIVNVECKRMCRDNAVVY